MNVSATQWAICRSIAHLQDAKKQHAQFCPQCHLLSAPHDSFLLKCSCLFFVLLYKYKGSSSPLFLHFLSNSSLCWFISESVKSIDTFSHFFFFLSSILCFPLWFSLILSWHIILSLPPSHWNAAEMKQRLQTAVSSVDNTDHDWCLPALCLCSSSLCSSAPMQRSAPWWRADCLGTAKMAKPATNSVVAVMTRGVSRRRPPASGERSLLVSAKSQAVKESWRSLKVWVSQEASRRVVTLL